MRRLLCGGVFPRGGRGGRTARGTCGCGGLDSGHGSVARLLDRRADRGERGGIAVVFHLHRVFQQVHHSVLDTGNTRSRLLDASGAGSTGHARDVEGLSLGHLLPRELLDKLHRLVDLLDDAGLQVVLQKDGGD